MKIHDYTKLTRCWGHDYVFRPINGGLKARISGWGEGISAGDYLILTHNDGSGETTRYRIDKIGYCRNPADMWHADCSWAPREVRKPA